MKAKYPIRIILMIITLTITVGFLPCMASEGNDVLLEDFDAVGPQGPDDKPMMAPDEIIERFLSRVREVDPEKAQQLETLRQEDPKAFQENIRGLMLEFRKEHKLFKQGGGGIFGGDDRPGGRRKRNVGDYTEWLAKEDPNAAAELEKLKETNPELYNIKVFRGYRKYRPVIEAAEDNPELAKLIKKRIELEDEKRSLVRSLRNTEDEKEKQKIKVKLEEVLSEKYDLFMEQKQLEYEHMLKRLEQLKARIKDREAAVEKWKSPEFKQQEIKKKITELTNEKERFPDDWDL